MESIIILLKGIFQVLLMLLKYILLKSGQFVLWSWKYLKAFSRWILRPKVYKIILSILGFLIPLLISLYFVFLPKIDIDFTDPFYEGDITTSLFSIKNQGNCNIYNVKPTFFVKNFKTENVSISNNVYSLTNNLLP